MKNVTQKFILKALLLAVVLCTHNLAFAAVEIDGIRYELNDSNLSASVISKFTKYKGAVIIPAEITYADKTYTVISIENYAFQGCNELTSVVLPNSLISINYCSFSDCS